VDKVRQQNEREKIRKIEREKRKQEERKRQIEQLKADAEAKKKRLKWDEEIVKKIEHT
jgi:vacuolar-type H+-ATPase subunit E/Vma4